MDKITNIKDYTIHIMPEPTLAIIPLKITDSKCATPIVKLKQIVKRGQCIAKANDDNSVDVFSPIYGRVVGFDMYPLSNRENSYCIFIENLNSDKIKINDSLLNAKVQAMKNSMKTNNYNRYDYDENKLNNIDNGQNKQDNVSKFADNCQNLQDDAKMQDKSEDLDKMLNSTNSVINFDLKDIEQNKNEDVNKNFDGVEDFYFEPYNEEDDLITFVDKCGLISQNGIKLSKELDSDKVILIPCFDAKSYAYENTAMLVKHFDEIYRMVELINNKLDKQIIFLHNHKDNLPDINCEWQGQWDNKIYKLLSKTTDYTKILKKCFNIIDVTDSQLDYGVLNNHFTILSPVTLYNLYKAVVKGIPHYSTYVTIGGQGLQKGGVYEVTSGCTLEHIQNSLGGTHSEQDIEDDKNDAMEAIEEYYEAKQAFKEEKDLSKKAELKAVMKSKKKIANKKAINYVKTVKKKINSCLGQIAFDDLDFGETHGNFQAVMELKNRRVYYLSVSQC